jgi:hypothetical protein
MESRSHASASGADPCRPSAASILADAALYNLGHAADGCDTAATHLRWLAGDARDEHGLEPDQWLSPEQCARLLRLATLADVLAAEVRALLEEIVP